MQVSVPAFVAVTVLLLLSSTLTEGFLPNRLRLGLVQRFLQLPDTGRTTTHADMTRRAILQATAVVLTEYPDTSNPQSSTRVQRLINSGVELDVKKIISSYYGSRFRDTLKRTHLAWQFDSVISYVNTYNAVVDYESGEVTIAGAHFDSEQFESGQKRLRCFRKAISEEILQRNYYTARTYTGRMLHTLQDFYSHTNWIENWSDEGNTIMPYNVLGDFDLDIQNTATESTPTCSDCTYTGLYDGFLLFHETRSCYDCTLVDNIVSSIKEQKILTSGYYNGGRDDENNIITKPPDGGKCSHGGFIDGTTDDSPVGGINKDSTHPKLASHYSLHRKAADVAQEHTMNMLLKIRQDVNNDKLFTEFLGFDENPLSSISIVVGRLTDQLLLEIKEYFTIAKNKVQQFSKKIWYNLVSLFEPDTGKI